MVWSRTLAPAFAALALAGCAGPAPHDRPSAQGAQPAQDPQPAQDAQPAPPDAAAHPDVLQAIPPGTQRVLLEAERFEVLALVCERAAAPGEEALHGYPVVGRVIVEDTALRREVLGHVYRGIADGDAVALCFEPHHAIVATRGEERVELVLCFECLQLRIYHPGGGPDDRGWSAMSTAARPVLTRVLGAVAERRVAGRTLPAWAEHLEARYAAPGAEAPPLAPEDRPGVAAVGELLVLATGDHRDAHADLLRRLGRRAAPALPSLRVLLDTDDPETWSLALELAANLGPDAAPLVPDLRRALDRDLAAWRAAVPEPEEDSDDPWPPGEDDVVGLRIAAMRALEAIGPAARDAVPALEALRDGDDPFLADAAALALEALGTEREER